MKAIQLEKLESYTGGKLQYCFGAGVLVAVVATNWWNPVGWLAAQGALLAAVGCIADD